MPDIVPIQPFSRFINMFPLVPEPGTLYELPAREDSRKPENAAFEQEGRFFSFTPGDDVKPANWLVRRFIEEALRARLKTVGFLFKGMGGYIAYWNKPHRQPFQDFFHTYSGFEFRVSFYDRDEDDHQVNFYLTLDPHVVLTMIASVGTLIRRGVAARTLTGLMARLRSHDDEESSGIDCRILEFDDKPGAFTCSVIDLRTSKKTSVDPDFLYLEPKPEVIQEKILRIVGRGEFSLIHFIRTKSFLESDQAAKERFNKTQQIVTDVFSDQKVFPLIIPGPPEISVALKASFVPIKGSSFPQEGRLPEPLLLFDQADSSATHLQPYHGLRAFGPYTKDKPLIRLALIGSKAGCGMLVKLVDDLNKGTSVMPGGVKRFFKTRLEVCDQEMIAGDDPDSYIASARSLATRNANQTALDVVMVHLTDRTSEMSLDTAYFAVKPVLLEYGLPSQMITQFALRDPAWKHANIASAIFAKAGGRPWVLAEDIPDFDMILGISLGERIAEGKRAGARPRFVSYANVFDRHGRWMFFESTAIPYDPRNHEGQVADLVAQAADRYKDSRGQFPKSVAVHYYKRFGFEERNSILSKLREKVQDFQIAFVSIDDTHPMRLYDLSVRDGSFPRGHFVKLSGSEVLLSVTGYTDLSQKRMGTPVVLKLTIDQVPSQFVSAEAIAKQVLALTRLNYKALTPVVGEPVTIKYARLAARFMAAFSEAQWKGVENSRVRNVPWFL